MTVGKYGFVGDEVLFDDRYKFTLVAMRQPTFLYSIEKEKLVTAGTILGKEVMKELVSQSMDRMAFRSCKMQEMNSKTGKTKPDSQPKGFRLRQKIIKTSCSEMGEKLDRQFQ